MRPLHLLWRPTVSWDWFDPGLVTIPDCVSESDVDAAWKSFFEKAFAGYLYPKPTSAFLSRHFVSACENFSIECSDEWLKRHFQVQNGLFNEGGIIGWVIEREYHCESPADAFSVLDFFEILANSRDLWQAENGKIIVRLTGDDGVEKAVRHWRNELFSKIYHDGFEYLDDEIWYPKSRIDARFDSGKHWNLPVSSIVSIPRVDWSIEDGIWFLPKNPTRRNLRFFSNHFFWFPHFSEEKKDSVDLLLIFSNPIEEGAIDAQGWQYEIIASILAGKRTLGILSTWSGKTHTFLLPGILLPWTVLIVAPLKSLIEDQYDNLKRKFGLWWLVERIHSWMDKDAKRETLDEIRLGEVKYVYVSPERLQIRKFFESCTQKSARLSMLAIDEAHCLSEWWHDFRLSYLNLKPLAENLSKSTGWKVWTLALTATASYRIHQDICWFLDIDRTIRESSLNRSNISMQVVRIADGLEKNEALKSVLRNDIPLVLRNPEHAPWIIFTIYGSIWKKTSPWSVWASAEAIYRTVLSWMDSDEWSSVWLFFSERKEEGTSKEWTIECCPKCKEIDPGKKVKFESLKSFFRKSWPYESKKTWFDGISNAAELTRWSSKDSWSIAFFDLASERYVLSSSIDVWKKAQRYEARIHPAPIFWCNKCLGIYERNWDIRDPQEILVRGWEKLTGDARWEKIKQETQDRFKKWECDLLVATKGFGMGIDKPDIRYVVHYVMSQSLEGYYQEIWRAWRDGKHSHCVVLFAPPCDTCMSKTANLSKDPPCMTDPEAFKFSKCPEGLESPCDYARQQKMIISPPVVQIRSKIEFAHEVLKKHWKPDECPNVTEWRWPTIQIKSFKETLLLESQSGFSHPLVEFWQFYYSMQNVIYRAFKNGDSTIPMRVPEKTLFRCMILGIVDGYFKDYAAETYEIRWWYGARAMERAKEFLREKLGVDERDFEIFKEDPAFLKIYEDLVEKKREWSFASDWWVAAMLLTFHLYRVVDNGRRQTFKNLFQSIQEVTKPQWGGCLRAKLLRRLWRDESEESMWKCGFCSGCVPSNRYEVEAGKLEKDVEILRNNTTFRQSRILGLRQAQEEAEKLRVEAEKLEKDRILRMESVLGARSMDLKWLVQTIRNALEKWHDISTRASQFLERWTYLPNSLFTVAYYSVNVWKDPEFEGMANEMYRFDKTDVFESMVEGYGLLDDVWKKVVDGLFEAAGELLPGNLLDAHTERKHWLRHEELIGMAIATYLVHNR